MNSSAVPLYSESGSEAEFDAKDVSSEEDLEHDGVQSSVHSSIDLEAYLKARDGIPDHPQDEEEEMRSVGSGKEMKPVEGREEGGQSTDELDFKLMEAVREEIRKILPKMVREAVEEALRDRQVGPSKKRQLREKESLKRTATK